MEVLNKILLRVRELQLFRGFKGGEGEHTEEVVYLFFTDDTYCFVRTRWRGLLNFILFIEFSSSFRSQYQFNKFEFVKLSGGSGAARFARVMGCKSVELLINYLGLSRANYKNVRTWDPVVVEFERRLAEWKRNLLSKGWRLTLIKKYAG